LLVQCPRNTEVREGDGNRGTKASRLSTKRNTFADLKNTYNKLAASKWSKSGNNGKQASKPKVYPETPRQIRNGGKGNGGPNIPKPTEEARRGR